MFSNKACHCSTMRSTQALIMHAWTETNIVTVSLWSYRSVNEYSRIYMEIFKPIKGGENVYIFFHIFHFSLFALSLDRHLISLLCQPLFVSISLSLLVLMIWCAGKEATCAKLTWDDTSRFITTGSPRDQKTRLKGLFQSINCLTCLTQVCEAFCISIKGPAWRENCSVAQIFQNVEPVVEYFSVNHVQWADKVMVIELAAPPTLCFFSRCVWFCLWMEVIHMTSSVVRTGVS